jgi:Alkylmercury lyase
MPENYPIDFDNRIKMVVYRATAESGNPPSIDAVADKMGESPAAVKESYARLRASRLLLLEADGATIRMAPPFSGVPTQHRVTVDDKEYYANCAWDALGIPAALHRPGVVYSRCEQSLEPLRLQVDMDGPEPSTWLFHCLVPAAKWWDDLVFT